MTTFENAQVKCFLCKHESSQRIIMSTSSFGSPDLDLRPSFPARNLIGISLQKCPSCGYVSYNIAGKTGIPGNFPRTKAYTRCDGHSFKSDLSKDYYRLFLICENEKLYQDAFLAMKICAWTCDDAGDYENAIICRKKALDALESMEQHPLESMREGRIRHLDVIKADLMRRAKLFDAVVEQYSSFTSRDERENEIIRFQIKKCMASDDKCYTIDDVKKGEIRSAAD